MIDTPTLPEEATAAVVADADTPAAVALAEDALAGLAVAVRQRVGAAKYDLWFVGKTVLRADAGGDDGMALTVGVANLFLKDWLQREFGAAVADAAAAHFGRPAAVRFRIDPALFQQARAQSAPKPASADVGAADTEVAADAPAPAAEGGAGAAPAAPVPRRTGPPRQSRWSLERFVVDDCNRLPHVALCGLVERPASAASPLIVYGGSGLGKTHLLKGAAEALQQRHPGRRILLLSCEEFTNDFVDGYRFGKLTSLRNRLRKLDMLLVDDIQFLGKKRATQEEFFHTLNALELRGARVVLSCDRHPRQLPALSPELKSRFICGMVARIEAPSRRLRRQLLMDHAVRRKLPVGAEVIDWLADRLKFNVCELEGAVNLLDHYRGTTGKPLDLATVQRVTVDLLRPDAPTLSVTDVRLKACELYALDNRQLDSRSRAKAVTQPRMLVLYLARQHTPATYAEIGRQVGGLGHSSVIAAEKRILKRLNAGDAIRLGDRTWPLRDAVDAFERAVDGPDAAG